MRYKTKRESAKDILPFEGDTFVKEYENGITLTVEIRRDEDMDAPWDNCDGHGPVSKWRPISSKAPGERVLVEDRGSARFYDVQEATKRARAEGWDAKPYGPKGETAGQRAARAVESDFQYLRGWVNDEWYYVYYVVTATCPADHSEYTDACGGYESNCEEYLNGEVRAASARVLKQARTNLKHIRADQEKRRNWLHCPHCGERSAGPDGEAFLEEGEYDQARDRYEYEREVTRYVCINENCDKTGVFYI